MRRSSPAACMAAATSADSQNAWIEMRGTGAICSSWTAASTEAAVQDEHIAPVPRISIQAFCESADVAAAMQAAGEDRRMTKAHLRVQMGGIAAAIEAYRASAT